MSTKKPVLNKLMRSIALIIDEKQNGASVPYIIKKLSSTPARPNPKNIRAAIDDLAKLKIILLVDRSYIINTKSPFIKAERAKHMAMMKKQVAAEKRKESSSKKKIGNASQNGGENKAKNSSTTKVSRQSAVEVKHKKDIGEAEEKQSSSSKIKEMKTAGGAGEGEIQASTSSARVRPPSLRIAKLQEQAEMAKQEKLKQLNESDSDSSDHEAEGLEDIKPSKCHVS